jgi:hypothetical protein
VQSKQTTDVCVYAFARMVAWKSVFLLQWQVTNEVLLSGPHIAERIVRWVPLSEADDVV